MILIISHSDDIATDSVTKKLTSYEVSYLRINCNEDNKLNFLMLNSFNDNIEITQSNMLIGFNKITASWYRNWFLLEKLYNSSYSHFNANSSSLNFHLKELEYLNIYLFKKIEEKKYYGSYTNSNISKLWCLELAKKCGFNIPKTIVATKKEQLFNFSKKIITKPIYESPKIVDGEYLLRPFTTEVNLDDLDEEFFPSLFQEKIDALCELRIFFFDSKYFAASIHTEIYDETVDWRYVWAENKKISLKKFDIPDEMLNNLKKLSKAIGINTGSYDFIVDKDGSLFFLEVNPCGQFSFLDVVFGDEIYEHIAQTLINASNEVGNTNCL